MSSRSRQGNPKLWLTALIATSIATVSYQVYNNYLKPSIQGEGKEEEEGEGASEKMHTKHPLKGDEQPSKKLKTHDKYTSKSIALTLSHSVLNSSLPLNDILLNSENITFILPPNLSLDDLACNIKIVNEPDNTNTNSTTTTTANTTINYKLPQTLIKNYKLLNCNNIQGYFNIIKNLKPDMLLVCADDLGIKSDIPKDLKRFAKEIITINQDRDDVYSTISQIFIK